jgi:hypothetical protein
MEICGTGVRTAFAARKTGRLRGGVNATVPIELLLPSIRATRTDYFVKPIDGAGRRC